MSELKVYHHELRHNEYAEFYLKYEADKEIQRLEKLCENYRCDCDNLAIMTDTMRKAGRTLRQKMNHQKHRRCLAMAKWCEATALWCYQAANTLPTGFHATLYGKRVMIEPDRLFKRHMLLTKWSARWRELAEKFKEAK